MKKIFIIAGENSGDKIGALVIKALKNASKNTIEFAGVGGAKMAAEGINSLFNIKEISLMGFFEILPHIFKLKKLIKQTTDEIIKFNPDILVTIDSPGFCYRVASNIKNISKTKLVHIVAPSVWAYKPERARKFAKIYNLLLTLLPFEPEYFTKEGLSTKFVGHFAFEQKLCKDKEVFKQKYSISKNEKLICLTPGSRNAEVTRHLPIFVKTIRLLSNKYIARFIFISANSEIKNIIEQYLKKSDITNSLVIDEDSFEAYKASDAAIAKSGTNSFEIALHKTPQIVAYKMNFLSWHYIKSAALIKYATLVNIISKKEIIPEFLQEKCKPEALCTAISKLLDDSEARDNQISATEEVLDSIKNPEGPASMIAANEILKLL